MCPRAARPSLRCVEEGRLFVNLRSESPKLPLEHTAAAAGGLEGRGEGEGPIRLDYVHAYQTGCKPRF